MSDVLERVTLPQGEARARYVFATARKLEYEEGPRLFAETWDPRETDVFLPLLTHVWTRPEEPIDDPARERILDAMWAIGQRVGVRAVLDTRESFSLFVPVRWDRGPDGFLLNVHDRGELDYMELGRATRFSYVRDDARPHVYVVRKPTDPRWRHPAGEPIDRERLDRILARIEKATSADMWFGKNHSFEIEIAGS